MMTVSQNNLTLSGKVAETPVFSHESHGETFMRFPLIIERLSKAYDTINVLVNKKHLIDFQIKPGDFVFISGELRSFNNKTETGSKLIVTAYAREIYSSQPEYINELSLTGVICKEPVYRKTPLGREICDLMLAINRKYGRADYLPCIAWGRNAYTAASLSVGDLITITGRVQSRNYTKVIDGIEHERITYEVSISSISENEDEIIS